MTPEIDNYYLSKEEPNRGCLLTLRHLILKQDPNITETLKWGTPCFSFKKKMCCFLCIDKKTNEPYILFVEGKHLEHPNLEMGNRSRMKSFNVHPNKDLPVNTIELLLNKALNLYKNGTIVIK